MSAAGAGAVGRASGGHNSYSMSYSKSGHHDAPKVKKPSIYQESCAHIALSNYQKNVSIMG